MTSAIDTQALQQIGLSSTPTKKAPDKLGQDAFLKLMTTQLQNQDPFKPMDNGAFLGQIAQFSTVSGIQDLQDSFSTFSSSLTSNQGLQAATLINHDVLIPADWVKLSDQGIQGAAELTSASNSVTANVYDASGQLVKTIPLGSQDAGMVNYSWDGTRDDGSQAPPGEYKIQIDSKVGGQSIAVENLVRTKVESVSFGSSGEGIKLSLTGLGERNFSEVRQIS